MRQLESIAKKAVWASLVLCSAMLWTEPVMAAKPQPVRQVLWYTRPATNWMTEALPVGNGRIGAMIFGGLARRTDSVQRQNALDRQYHRTRRIPEFRRYFY